MLIAIRDAIESAITFIALFFIAFSSLQMKLSYLYLPRQSRMPPALARDSVFFRPLSIRKAAPVRMMIRVLLL
jgi:hypothetical protein